MYFYVVIVYNDSPPVSIGYFSFPVCYIVCFRTWGCEAYGAHSTLCWCSVLDKSPLLLLELLIFKLLLTDVLAAKATVLYPTIKIGVAQWTWFANRTITIIHNYWTFISDALLFIKRRRTPCVLFPVLYIITSEHSLFRCAELAEIRERRFQTRSLGPLFKTTRMEAL